MSDGGTQIKLAAFDKLATWLSSQPITNVLLILQLLLLAGGGYGTVKYIIPVHLKQIQDGYERIDKEHTKQIDTINKSRELENSRAFGIIESMLKKHENGGVLKLNANDVAGKEPQ